MTSKEERQYKVQGLLTKLKQTYQSYVNYNKDLITRKYATVEQNIFKA